MSSRRSRSVALRRLACAGEASTIDVTTIAPPGPAGRDLGHVCGALSRPALEHRVAQLENQLAAARAATEAADQARARAMRSAADAWAFAKSMRAR